MASGDNASISALAELLDELVFGVDNECGVERYELVSLHSSCPCFCLCPELFFMGDTVEVKVGGQE